MSFRIPFILLTALLGGTIVGQSILAIEPSDLSGLKLWLDAQDTATLTVTGDMVSQWANKADSANPASQANGDNQPTLSSAGLNERPSVYFDGSRDNLLLSSTIRDTAGEFHLFVVASGESGGNTWARIAASWSGNGDPWAAPNWVLWAPNNGGVVESFEPSVKISNGSNQVLQNIVIGSDAANPNINHFKGHIGEVLLYDRQLDGEELTQILDYLNSRWGFESETYKPPTGVNLKPRLRDLGEALGIKMGSITRDNFYNFPETDLYQRTLGENFSIMTTGNAAKFGPLSSGQGTYDFTTLDQHLSLSEAYDMQFHGHVFIWHNQLPNWLSSGTWTRQELIDILNDHIDQVGGYLKAKVALWDVVNEPFNTNGTWRSSVWNDTIDADNTAPDQRDFIDLAFQRARQVDPDAKLILNDFSVAQMNAKSDAMYAWAQSMIARNIPLDGVGFQMHLSGPINYDSFAQNMQRFADLGLEVHITELDVRMEIPFSNTKAATQAEIYRQVLRRVLAQPAVKTFTMWGFTDAHSWIPTHFPGTDNALIFDKDYNPKPAFVALQEELMDHLSTANLKNALLGDAAQSPEADLDKDLDHDGLSTFFEIAMELDPAKADFQDHPQLTVTEDQAAAIFTPREFTSDIEIRVETSPNLSDWEILAKRPAGSFDWEIQKHGVNLLTDSMTGKVTVTDTSLANPAFLRIITIQSSGN